MAINQELVNEVCNVMAGAGGVPTLVKVREALGSGSMATIAKMVREWKNATDTKEEPVTTVTPESIQAMAAKMWAEAQRLAAMQYEAHRAEMAAQVVSAEEALESACNEMQAEVKRMEQQYNELKASTEKRVQGLELEVGQVVKEREAAFRAAELATEREKAASSALERAEKHIGALIAKLEPQQVKPPRKATTTG